MTTFRPRVQIGRSRETIGRAGAGTADAVAGRAESLTTIGAHILRYGLVLLTLWFGAFKFTAAEANAIEPLIAHSPLTSWLYSVTDLRGASRLIGVAEILVALLIAVRR